MTIRPWTSGFAEFAIGFDDRDRSRLHALWDGVLDSQRWSDGALLTQFEQGWGRWNCLSAVAFSSWSGAALAALAHFEASGQTVLCPSNTFMATPLAALRAGARVVFVDCNREDLCMSFADFERKAEEHRPGVAFLVHIGGHIAFDVEQIAAYCRAKGIILFEDCAHAHGASWHGRRPGTWGDAAIWSFAADQDDLDRRGWHAGRGERRSAGIGAAFRDYGKPDYSRPGLNFRMTEFTAALGIVAVERMEEIAAWKNDVGARVARRVHPRESRFPRDDIRSL